MINCNNHRWDFSQQLWANVDHLSKHRPPPAYHNVCIDACCINQYERGDKAEQSPCMRAVYGRAEWVVVWLGEHADGSEIVIREILSLSKKLVRVG